MKVVATVAAVAVAAIAATAGVTGTGRVAPATQKPCTPQTKSHALAIGRLLKVNPEAAVGNSSLAPSDRRAIGKDSTLCTYLPYGQIKFVVNPKVTCWMTRQQSACLSGHEERQQGRSSAVRGGRLDLVQHRHGDEGLESSTRTRARCG